MKILITESQVTPLIEKLIKSNIPNVVSVNFENIPTISYGDDDEVTYDDVMIQVIVDAGKVFEGNIYPCKYVEATTYNPSLIYKQISNILKNYLNIDIARFRAGYSLKLFIVATREF